MVAHAVALRSDLNSNVLAVRQRALWDKKRRDNKHADRAAGDWRLAGYISLPYWNIRTMEKKYIQYLHMLFPFPLIRSSLWGQCPAQLHMKQHDRGLWQRKAISSIPINLWQSLQSWTVHYSSCFYSFFFLLGKLRKHVLSLSCFLHSAVIAHPRVLIRWKILIILSGESMVNTGQWLQLAWKKKTETVSLNNIIQHIICSYCACKTNSFTHWRPYISTYHL